MLLRNTEAFGKVITIFLLRIKFGKILNSGGSGSRGALKGKGIPESNNDSEMFPMFEAAGGPMLVLFIPLSIRYLHITAYLLLKIANSSHKK